MTKVKWLRSWFATYNDPPAGDPPPPPPPSPPPSKTFTQDDVNRLLAEDRRKNQQKNQELISQLETLKQNSQLTQEEKNQLQQQIEQLQNTSLTKEQQWERDRKKLLDTHEATAKTLTTERDAWKNNFTQMLIHNELLSAADREKAVNNEQIRDLLSHKSKVVPVLDEQGKPKENQFKVVVTWNTLDPKTKEPVTLDLPVGDVLKLMKEQPQLYGNLFQGTATSGTGTSGGSGAGASGGPPSDHGQYLAWRKAQGFDKP